MLRGSELLYVLLLKALTCADEIFKLFSWNREGELFLINRRISYMSYRPIKCTDTILIGVHFYKYISTLQNYSNNNNQADPNVHI
jgi:hypothetical protein